MELMKASLGVGNITKQSKDSIRYCVTSVKELQVIIDHFDKYPLITQKLADYQLFKQVFEMVNRKEHLTEEGLKKIVAIRASNGLSDELKSAFPHTITALRPKVVAQEIKDPNWLAGFTEGEGCFYVKIANLATKKGPVQLKLFSLNIREIVYYLIACFNIWVVED
jgi:hypothetical protein